MPTAVASATSPAAARTAARLPADAVTAMTNLTGTGASLAFNPATLAAFKAAGVTVAASGGSTVGPGGASMNFPITSGYAEIHSDRSFKPSYVLGSIELYGSGLVLGVAGASVDLTDLVVDLGQSMVYGTIGSTEDVPLFSLGHRALTARRNGNTLSVGGLTTVLTATGAAELDAAFHTAAITAEMPIGVLRINGTGNVSSYAYTTNTAEISRLSGIATSVTLGPAVREVLARVGATPGAFGSAIYDSNGGTLRFPITGGTAVVHPRLVGKVGYLDGVVLHQGSGIVLARGSTSVTMTDLTMVPDASTVYASVNGGADNADLFALAAQNAQVKMADGNIEVNGAVLTLTTGAAAMLNSVFSTNVFVPGTELGTVDLVASGR